VSSPQPAAAPAPAPRPAPRLAYDVARLGLAALVGLLWGLVVLVLRSLSEGELLSLNVLPAGLFAFSAMSSLFYIVHTLWVFNRVDPATLRAWLIETTPKGRFGNLGAELSGTGPTIAVQWSVIAIATVLTFTVWPGLLQEATTVWLSVLVVAASWSVTVVAYAVHYARLDVATSSLSYPGDGPRSFLDYLYLSVQVQTTFSTSDVSLLTTGARGIVTGHTLVSFAFNTVIIAMLITVLFLGR